MKNPNLDGNWLKKCLWRTLCSKSVQMRQMGVFGGKFTFGCSKKWKCLSQVKFAQKVSQKDVF